ncbi:MAG: hypothetical protein DLM54_11770 [Acidimicrobiales bacterium]|nr:MAG: hypothetical protein DLM54_11770 [Acidimicrobiales bacterium]
MPAGRPAPGPCGPWPATPPAGRRYRCCRSSWLPPRPGDRGSGRSGRGCRRTRRSRPGGPGPRRLPPGQHRPRSLAGVVPELATERPASFGGVDARNEAQVAGQGFERFHPGGGHECHDRRGGGEMAHDPGGPEPLDRGLDAHTC